MPDPLEFIPGYVSPLTDKEHAQIGRIAILWGQIEHFVETLLTRVSGFKWEELEAIQLVDKPIAAKVGFLKAASARVTDQTVRDTVLAFCAEIDGTKASRNHVFHGIWGWRGDKRTKKVIAAARKRTVAHAPFKVTQLAALEKRLCKASRLGEDLLVHYGGHGFRVKYARYLHHGDQENAPKWFREWSDRNPLDLAALDQSTTGSQLPRLPGLLPEH